MKRWISAIVIFSLILLFGRELFHTFYESKERTPIQTMQATDFTLPSLNGGERSLHQEQGKVVILNFWASWCEPCKTEMPHFQTFYESYKKDVEILAVNVTSKDKVANVKQFVEEHALTFPILLDESGETSTMYGAFALPTTIILDREGNIHQEIVGPMDETLLLEYIEPLF